MQQPEENAVDAVDMAWDMPKASPGENVQCSASMKLGQNVFQKSNIPDRDQSITFQLLTSAFVRQCLPRLLPRSEALAHFLVTDKYLVIRVSELIRSTDPTIWHWLCFFLPGGYCSSEERELCTQKDYVFSRDDLIDLHIEPEYVHEHKREWTEKSEEGGNRSTSMLFYCDHWHDSVKMTMAFTTRYGELIPGADWGHDPSSDRFYQCFTFQGVLDREQMHSLYDVLGGSSGRRMEKETGKLAAPMSGAERNPPGYYGGGHREIGDFVRKIKRHPLLGDIDVSYGDFTRGYKKRRESPEHYEERNKVERILGAGDRWLERQLDGVWSAKSLYYSYRLPRH